jgi:hypothetical protein
MRVKMTFAVLALAALALALPASSAANGSRTVHVDAGESIQAAVDNAKPGTTIKLGEGTFHESVSIAKDDISIVGEGRKKTLIAFEGAGTPPECGICVSPAQQGGTVEDVHISRLAVSGFGFGILFSDSEDISVQRTHLYDNHEYGVAAFGSTEGVYSRNIAPNNGEAGIYVGSSPEAKSVIYKNVTWGNMFGIFVRDAAHGQVLKNKSFGNCVGMLFLETGDPSAVNHDWLVKGNNATANNLSDATLCAGEGGPPVSGVGIAIAGARDLEVVHNGAFGNRSGIANSFLSAGIALIDTTDDGGGPPTDNTIAFNTAFGNQPVDLFAEGHVAANRFFANDCLTSQPDGLCEDPDGEHGDDDDDRGDDHPKGDRGHHKGDHKKHKKSKKHRKHKKHKKHDRDDD